MQQADNEKDLQVPQSNKDF